MNPLIKNILVNGPNFFLFSSIFIAIIINQKIGYYYIILEIISHIVNYIIKNIIKQKRPDGAKGCHDYVTCNEKTDTYGMPSGHAQSMGIILSFWLLYIWRYNKQNTKYIGSLFIIISSFSVIYSRVLFKCHTELQVIIGFIIGLFIGFIGFRAFLRH